jgi:hypothetical protein
MRRSFFRRFRWLILGGGALIVLLLLLAALTPWIASTSWARGLVLARVNERLNGTLEVRDWSLSWGGGTTLSGLRVVDSSGRQILQVGRLSTDLSTWDILRGNYYHLGKTRVEDLDFVFVRYADGTSNFDRLVKDAPAPPSAPQPTGPASPSTLPDLRGEFDIAFRGTLEQHQPDGSRQLVILDPSTIHLKVPDINARLEHQINIAMRSGSSGAAGRLTASGAAKLFDAHRFVLEKLEAEEVVQVRSLDAAAALAFLDPRTISRLAGITDGNFTVRTVGGDQIVIEGSSTTANFALGGGIFDGDTLSSPTLNVKVPRTTFTRSSGRLRTGDGPEPAPITLTLAQGNAELLTDATLDALRRLAANQKPGAAGRITSRLTIDLAKLAEPDQLRRFLKIQNDTQVERGTLQHRLDVALAADKATIQTNLDVPELQGTRGQGAQRRPVRLNPLHVAFSADHLGGGSVIPDLRNMLVKVASDFATLDGGGKSLEALALNGSADLARFQQELGQFRDFGQAKFAGTVALDVRTEGDLVNPGSTATLSSKVTGKHLRIENILEKPIDEPNLQLTANAKLNRGEQHFIQAITDGLLVLKAGRDLAAPTLDARLEQVRLDTGGQQLSAAFPVVRMNVDLPKADAEFAPLLNLPPGAQLQQGNLIVAGDGGTWDGAKARFDSLTAKVERLTLLRDGNPVVRNYTPELAAAGGMEYTPAALAIRLQKLTVKDNQELLALEKLPERDVLIELPAAGGFAGSGALALIADLPRFGDILNTWNKGEGNRIKSGRLDGTIDLAANPQRQTKIAADPTAKGLSIDTPDPKHAIRDETVVLSLRGSASDRLAQLNGQSLSLKSSFAEVDARELLVNLFKPRGAELEPVPLLEMVQSAKLRLAVANLPRLQSLIDAFIPPAPVATAAANPAVIGRRPTPPPDADEPAPGQEPLHVTGGSLAGNLALARDAQGLNVTVERLDGKAIQLRRGRNGPELRPTDIVIELAAFLRTDTSNPTATLAQQIREYRVPRLNITSALANVGLRDPIVFTQAGGNYEGTGTITVNGGVRPMSDLLNVLGYEWPDAAGSYKAVQRLNTRGPTLIFRGDVNINDLAVATAGGARFSEKHVRLVNDLDWNQKNDVLKIDKLDLSMASSRALDLSVSGRITKLALDRELKDMQVVLGYDAGPLLELVRPFLSPEAREQIKTLKASGEVRGQRIALSGKFPVRPRPDPNDRSKKRPPVWFTIASGTLVVPSAEFQGMRAESEVRIPWYLEEGILRTASKGEDGKPTLPEPIRLAGGTLDVGGFEINLTGDFPTISHPKPNHPLVNAVSVSDTLVDNYLGTATPFFAGATNTSGKMSVVLVKLQDLPLGAVLKSGAVKRGYQGMAELDLDSNLRMAPPPFVRQLTQVLSLADPNFIDNPINLRNARFILRPGSISAELELPMLGHRFATAGTVDLSTYAVSNMSLAVPKELIPAKWIPRQVRDLPVFQRIEAFEVPIRGTPRRPVLDIEGAVKNQFDAILKDPTQWLPGLLDGGRRPRARDDRDDRPEPPGTIGRPDRAREPRAGAPRDDDLPPGTDLDEAIDLLLNLGGGRSTREPDRRQPPPGAIGRSADDRAERRDDSTPPRRQRPQRRRPATQPEQKPPGTIGRSPPND